MKFDVNDAIETLTGGWGEPTVPFEHAILLHQLQTWIYFPKGNMVDCAGMLAASRYLHAYGTAFAREGSEKNGAAQLKDCLNDQTYAVIYNYALKPFGGWTCLMRTPSLQGFDRLMKERRQQCDMVCSIIDYRYRYLAHGGDKKSEANISHGQFYCWKGDRVEVGKDEGTLSGKTIRTRWSTNQPFAEFLYVSEKLPNFWPTPMGAHDFVDALQKQAENRRLINKFLGMTARVIDQLRGTDEEAIGVTIPSSVRRIPPNTLPLSERETKRMSFYGAEYEQMRQS